MLRNLCQTLYLPFSMVLNFNTVTTKWKCVFLHDKYPSSSSSMETKKTRERVDSQHILVLGIHSKLDSFLFVKIMVFTWQKKRNIFCRITVENIIIICPHNGWASLCKIIDTHSRKCTGDHCLCHCECRWK
jgi:hypothetical protein